MPVCAFGCLVCMRMCMCGGVFNFCMCVVDCCIWVVYFCTYVYVCVFMYVIFVIINMSTGEKKANLLSFPHMILSKIENV